MENCNVCNAVIPSGTGVFISGLIKGADVYGCQECKLSVEKAQQGQHADFKYLSANKKESS